MKAETELDTLISKMDLVNNSVDVECETNVVDDYLSKMEILISEFLGALEKFKVVDGKDVEGEYEAYINIPTIFSADLYMAKLVKQKLEEVKNFATRTGIKNKVLIMVQSLHTENLLRFGSLRSKIDVNLNWLSDYQIL